MVFLDPWQIVEWTCCQSHECFYVGLLFVALHSFVGRTIAQNSLAGWRQSTAKKQQQKKVRVPFWYCTYYTSYITFPSFHSKLLQICIFFLIDEWWLLVGYFLYCYFYFIHNIFHRNSDVCKSEVQSKSHFVVVLIFFSCIFARMILTVYLWRPSFAYPLHISFHYA